MHKEQYSNSACSQDKSERFETTNRLALCSDHKAGLVSVNKESRTSEVKVDVNTAPLFHG